MPGTRTRRRPHATIGAGSERSRGQRAAGLLVVAYVNRVTAHPARVIAFDMLRKLAVSVADIVLALKRILAQRKPDSRLEAAEFVAMCLRWIELREEHAGPTP